MNCVDRVKQLCKERKVPISRLEKDLGFSNGYIGQLKKGTLPNDRLIKVADYFGVTADYLMTGNNLSKEICTCPDCGLSYTPTEIEDAKEHIRIHEAWKAAQNKFGVLYCNVVLNEEIKSKNRAICNNTKNSLEVRYNAALEVLRCLFSRSLSASGFDLSHPSFKEYVAMMMNNESYHKKLGNDLSQKLIDNFGTLPGIKNGESYYVLPKSATRSKVTTITSKDERDIKKDLDSLMEKLSTKEYGPAAYDGEELSEDSIALFKDEVEIALRRLKLINKEKYTPKKYKE